MTSIADTRELCDLVGIDFSPEQLAVITAPVDVVQAVIAGAGSGKTAVMAARVLWLVGHDGVDPERVLGLTFTNKAAGELGRRIRGALALLGVPRDEGEPTVATYNAFASQLISEHGLRLGMESDLRVMADATRYQLAARVVLAHGRLDHVTTSLPKAVAAVVRLDGQLAEHLVPTEELRCFDTRWVKRLSALDAKQRIHEQMTAASLTRLELCDLVDAYREAKLEAGVLDFSDQMEAGARLAERPEVQADLRARFDTVLLDEYQDTSVSQRMMLQRLFAGRGVSAVGDPAQGIYGWRGAASGNLVSFLDHFAPPGFGGHPHSLAVSQRCGAEIIDLAGYVAREFYESPEVNEVVRPLTAAGHTGSGFVSLGLHESVDAEIDDLVERVRAAHERVEWSEIAILVRASRENEAIVARLRAGGIPFEILGLSGLLDVPEVLDVVALLEVTEDLTANPAMLRLLTGPRWRVGDRDLALLGRRATELTRAFTSTELSGGDGLDAVLAEATASVDPTGVVALAEAVEDPGPAGYSPEALERFADIAGILRRMRRHSHEPLLDLARRAARELDVDVELAVSGIGTDQLDAFFDAVGAYARNDRYASLGGLLAYLRAEREHNRGMERVAPSSADSVKIMTVHKAKGLEFDEVFVPLVCGDIFPSRQGRARWHTNSSELPIALRGDAEHLPELTEFERTKDVNVFTKELAEMAHLEESRLAYVAFTRARKRLHVSGHRWGRTQKKPRSVSPFMQSSLEWLKRQGRAPEIWAPEPPDDAVNPFERDAQHSWPRQLTGLAEQRRAARRVAEARLAPQLPEGPKRLEALGRELELLMSEAQGRENTKVVVTLPEQLSTTASLGLARNPDEFAFRLARRMPVRPSSAARFGTRFHAWIESRYGQRALLDPEELIDRADPEIADDAELVELKRAFESGPFVNRDPVAVEVPFTLMIGGQQLIGRIDAVFETTLPDGTRGWEVVDWKTNKAATADPLQLAVYRLAWARHRGVEPERVIGSFHYVRLGRTDTFDDLPSAEDVEAALGLP